MAYPVLDANGEPTGDQWLTTGEAAELSGVPAPTLYLWASEGRGPEHRRVGKRWAWRRSAVIALLATA